MKFVGDYFGLLLNKRATGFPFNVMNNPMYWGSTMNFLGYSLRYNSNVQQADLYVSDIK